jgi:hypothetical protein
MFEDAYRVYKEAAVGVHASGHPTVSV